MAADFLMNVFNGPHFALPDALDHRPAGVFGRGLAGAAAGGKVLPMLLMDVWLGVGILLPAAHHLFREVRGNVQIEGQVRAGQPQLVIFKVIQPLQKCLLGFRRLLAGLMDGVGCGVAVGNDESAIFIPVTPHLFIGCIAVYSVESGCGVSVDIGRAGTEFTSQIHPDQCRAGLCVLREYQLLKFMAFLFQTLRQQAELGGLAGTVGAFDND